MFSPWMLCFILLNISNIWCQIPDLQPNSGGIPDDAGCTCVAYYLCNNGTINTNGEGIIDIRSKEGPCDNYMQVCCKPEDKVEQPTKTPPREKPKGCGFRNPKGVGFRITGDNDNEAQFAEFPWMVAILKGAKYQCGGALIHPQVVMTAAHCVKSENEYRIRAGEWDTQHTQEPSPFQDRNVQSLKIHPQFYSGGLYNDIALLYLESPVSIADNVDVICLPRQDARIDKSRCFATGWGKDVFGKQGKYQVILKKIDLPIVSQGQCEEDLRKTRLGSQFQLHRTFMCAGGEPGKDACKGDGGSPLVCPIANSETGERFYQAGIVSWGIGCGDKDVPGVYANVASFRDWIEENMKLFGLEYSDNDY